MRAVVTGFGFTLGSALYRRVSKRLGLDDEQPSDAPPPNSTNGADAGGQEREQASSDGA